MSKIQITRGDIKMMVSECVRRINESMVGGNQVNMIVDRFQPFTNDDLNMLQQFKQANGLPTVLLTTPGKGDKQKPFMGEVQSEMLNRVKNAYPELIADIIMVKNADIVANIAAIKEHGFEPVKWYANADRIKWYNTMVERYGQQVGLVPEFEVAPIDKGDSQFSQQSVIEALMNDDYEEFEYDVPECLADMYDTMKQAVGGGAPVNEGLFGPSKKERAAKEEADRIARGDKIFADMKASIARMEKEREDDERTRQMRDANSARRARERDAEAADIARITKPRGVSDNTWKDCNDTTAKFGPRY